MGQGAGGPQGVTGRSMGWGDLGCPGPDTPAFADHGVEDKEVVVSLPLCGGGVDRSQYDLSAGELSLLNSILIKASSKGKVAAVDAALEAGANIEARSAAVTLADNQELAPDHMEEMLFDESVEVAPCIKGPTPLMRASKGAHAEAAALLLSRRATPHARDELGRTALHFAAAAGSFETCLVLLRAGAQRWTLDVNGKDAFAHLPAAEKAVDVWRWGRVLRPGGEWCSDLTGLKQTQCPVDTGACRGDQNEHACFGQADLEQEDEPSSEADLDTFDEATPRPRPTATRGRKAHPLMV